MTSSLPDYTERAAAPSVSYATFDHGRHAFRDNWVLRIDHQSAQAEHASATRRTFVAAMACLLLSACADDSGPQFASNPVSTPRIARTSSVATPAPMPTTPPIATPTSIGEVLFSRGAPARLYFMSGQHVWTATADGDVRSLYLPTAGETILGVTAAPSGDLVAVLVERAAPEPGILVIVLDANGAVQQQIAVGSSRALATPVAAASVPTVDWSPQGDQLLVLLQDGEILAIALASGAAQSPTILNPPGEDIRAAAWSPTGEAIAYLAASAEDRSRSLVVQRAGSGAADPVVPASDQRAVVEFSWMPDGAALLFTEGAIAAGAISGVDLWQVATDGTDRQLVASAGSVAPVARITLVRPSPDGRRVAYAVLVPGDDLPRFDSIWVRDLASRAGYQVEMPPVAAVRDIWWTASGLLVLADEAADSAVQTGTAVLLHVSETGVAQIVWRAPRPAATPFAGTPVASPASS